MKLLAPLLALGVMGAPCMVSAQSAPTQGYAIGSGYILGPEDIVEISFYGPTVTTVKTRIKANGDVTVPLIGTVKAGGETVTSLGQAMARRLKAEGFFTNPIVNVEITTYASNSVTVLGQVSKPGIYALEQPYRLSEMIARVGGLQEGASSSIEVRRARSQGAERYNIADLARNGQQDVQLAPGDVVFVDAAERFYIYGQVGNGGLYPITPGMTVRQALARAGGPTLSGSQDKIRLYRKGREAEAQLDAAVEPDDVLFVRERIF